MFLGLYAVLVCHVVWPALGSAWDFSLWQDECSACSKVLSCQLTAGNISNMQPRLKVTLAVMTAEEVWIWCIANYKQWLIWAALNVNNHLGLKGVIVTMIIWYDTALWPTDVLSFVALLLSLRKGAMAGQDSDSKERAWTALGFMLLIFGLAVVIQSHGFFHVTNANAAVTQTVGGSAHTAALITDSHGSPVQVAHAAHTDSRIQQTTIHVRAKKHEVQKMLADNEMEEQRVQSGYGSILDAEKVLKRLLSKEPKISKDGKCDPPRLLVLDRCICPAGSKWDASSKSCTQTLGEMFFYMYRAQSDNNYIMSNIDMADLAGVMYYLHNEIVKNNLTEGVRMNGITRILRFLVTMRPSPELASQMKVFMPFVAFDEGRCSVPGCNKLWEHYGFAVGCQKQGASTGFAYSEDSSGAWFSLPGACPVLPVGSKDT